MWWYGGDRELMSCYAAAEPVDLFQKQREDSDNNLPLSNVSMLLHVRLSTHPLLSKVIVGAVLP